MAVISCLDSNGHLLFYSKKECLFHFGKVFFRSMFYGVFKIIPSHPIAYFRFRKDNGETFILNEKRLYGYIVYDERDGIIFQNCFELPLAHQPMMDVKVADYTTQLYRDFSLDNRKYFLVYTIENFTERDFHFYCNHLNSRFVEKITEFYCQQDCECCSKFKRRAGMEIFDDFIAITDLSTEGEFNVEVPPDCRNKDLIVQVKTLATELPFDFNNCGSICEENDEPIFENEEVSVMRLRPGDLPFSSNYTSDIFMAEAKKITTSTENRLKKNLDLAFSYAISNPNNPLSIDMCFDNVYLNKIYENFHMKDVVIFAEYGVSLNYTGRLKSTHFTNKETKITNIEEVNNGVRCMDARIYGFNLGFKFMRHSTIPFLDNTVLSQQFLPQLFDSETEREYGFYDMLRYVISDIGEYEWFGQPDISQIQMRREGLGVYIFFEKTGTYLTLTFTAGALPYVLIPGDIPGVDFVVLKDRDYSDISLPQKILVMRPTLSKLSANDGEYTLDLSYARGDNFYKKLEESDAPPRFRCFENKVKHIPIDSDIVFDCPISFQPLFDLERNGNYLSFPIYGGLMPYLNIFYAYLFFTSEAKISKERFFLTGTGFFNFLSGNITTFYVMNGFYPFEKKEGVLVKNFRVNLMNPQLKGEKFVRLQFMQIFRNLSYTQKVKSILEHKITSLGILVKYTDMKNFLTSNGRNDSKIDCVEMIPTVTDYYPIRDFANFNFIPFIPPESKPLYTDKPFQFRFQPSMSTMKDVIQFRIVGLNNKGEIVKACFAEGDKVMMKGSFVTRF